MKPAIYISLIICVNLISRTSGRVHNNKPNQSCQKLQDEIAQVANKLQSLLTTDLYLELEMAPDAASDIYRHLKSAQNFLADILQSEPWRFSADRCEKIEPIMRSVEEIEQQLGQQLQQVANFYQKKQTIFPDKIIEGEVNLDEEKTDIKNIILDEEIRDDQVRLNRERYLKRILDELDEDYRRDKTLFQDLLVMAKEEHNILEKDEGIPSPPAVRVEYLRKILEHMENENNLAKEGLLEWYKTLDKDEEHVDLTREEEDQRWQGEVVDEIVTQGNKRKEDYDSDNDETKKRLLQSHNKLKRERELEDLGKEQDDLKRHEEVKQNSDRNKEDVPDSGEILTPDAPYNSMKQDYDSDNDETKERFLQLHYKLKKEKELEDLAQEKDDQRRQEEAKNSERNEEDASDSGEVLTPDAPYNSRKQQVDDEEDSESHSSEENNVPLMKNSDGSLYVNLDETSDYQDYSYSGSDSEGDQSESVESQQYKYDYVGLREKRDVGKQEDKLDGKRVDNGGLREKRDLGKQGDKLDGKRVDNGGLREKRDLGKQGDKLDGKTVDNGGLREKRDLGKQEDKLDGKRVDNGGLREKRDLGKQGDKLDGKTVDNGELREKRDVRKQKDKLNGRSKRIEVLDNYTDYPDDIFGEEEEVYHEESHHTKDVHDENEDRFDASLFKNRKRSNFWREFARTLPKTSDWEKESKLERLKPGRVGNKNQNKKLFLSRSRRVPNNSPFATKKL